MPNRKLITFACFSVLLFNTLLGYATTVIAIITANGIVIGSDTKMIKKAGDSTPLETGVEERKIVLVADNRILIASSGFNKGLGYDFPNWIDGISKRLPKNISVKDFVAFLEKESAAQFKDFDDLVLKTGLLTPAPVELCRPFIQYMVLGYDGGKPWVYLVQFYIDWDRGHLVGPKTSIMHPTQRSAADVGMYPIGQVMATVDIANGNSYAHKQAVLHCPKALAQFFTDGNVNKIEAVALITVLIHVQEEVNPSEVGGLGRFFYLPKIGGGAEIGPRRSPPLGKPD